MGARTIRSGQHIRSILFARQTPRQGSPLWERNRVQPMRNGSVRPALIQVRHRLFKNLIRLDLIANVAHDQGFAVRRPAFFTMKATRDIPVGTIRAQLPATTRTFFPVASTLLTAIGALKGDGELQCLNHNLNLRPI